MLFRGESLNSMGSGKIVCRVNLVIYSVFEVGLPVGVGSVLCHLDLNKQSEEGSFEWEYRFVKGEGGGNFSWSWYNSISLDVGSGEKWECLSDLSEERRFFESFTSRGRIARGSRDRVPKQFSLNRGQSHGNPKPISEELHSKTILDALGCLRLCMCVYVVQAHARIKRWIDWRKKILASWLRG